MKTYTYSKTLTSGEFKTAILVNLSGDNRLIISAGTETLHPLTMADMVQKLKLLERTEQARIDKLNSEHHEIVGALAALDYKLAATSSN